MTVGQDNPDHAFAETGLQRCCPDLSAIVGIERNVQSPELAQGVNVLRADSIAQQRDSWHSPLSECEPIEWTFNDDGCSRIRKCFFPSEQGLRAGQPEIRRTLA